MNKIFFAALTGWAMKFFKGSNQDAAPSPDIDRFKMSLLYVKSIKTVRMLFLSFLGVGVCLVFLSTGLNLFNTTLFAYTSLDIQAKMYIGFSLTFLYLLIAAWIFQYCFSHETWLSIFNAKEIMKDIEGEGNTSLS